MKQGSLGEHGGDWHLGVCDVCTCVYTSVTHHSASHPFYLDTATENCFFPPFFFSNQGVNRYHIKLCPEPLSTLGVFFKLRRHVTKTFEWPLTVVVNHVRMKAGQHASVEIKPGVCDLADRMGDMDPRDFIVGTRWGWGATSG